MKKVEHPPSRENALCLSPFLKGQETISNRKYRASISFFQVIVSQNQKLGWGKDNMSLCQTAAT